MSELIEAVNTAAVARLKELSKTRTSRKHRTVYVLPSGGNWSTSSHPGWLFAHHLGHSRDGSFKQAPQSWGAWQSLVRAVDLLAWVERSL